MFFAPCGASLKASVIFMLFSSIASTFAAPVVGPSVTGLEARSATITDTSMPRETSSSSSSAMSNGAMSNGELRMSVTFEGDSPQTVTHKKVATILFQRLVKGFAREQFKVGGSWEADDVTIKDLGKLKPSGHETYTFDLSGFSGSQVVETGAKYRGEMKLVDSKKPTSGTKRTLSFNGTIQDATTGKVVHKVEFGQKVDISKGPAEDTKNAEPTGTFKAGSEAPSSTSTSSAVASSKT
ncbi:hypothetical protein DFJ43DRAFT_1154148 [Lentinula guzmanii]|uniref:Uncharacterized protein n=1 Tax=Lentinula guzmanii TaxID=2804957 RepID=A0AA38JAX6_9AGAR|nr:hypothetical protein DFJ43DRAFT_1154148 [Lentinula guzmanii]